MSLNKIFFLIVITFAKMNAQNITYYSENNEDFADVYVEDNLVFTCRVAGKDNTGPTVILLHGFPETSKMWSKLLPFLSAKNYRVIAPDQRGYSSGARPLKVKDYSAHKLAQDVINIADSFGAKKFHLVGHDWGSAIGWYLSAFNKNRIISYSALAVPHLDAFGDAILNDRIQKKKSTYIKFFRIRFLPEIFFKMSNYANLKRIWTSSDDQEINSYMSVFSQKNALKTALHWYRATKLNSPTKIGDIHVPTLMIYGKKDLAIGEKAVDETKKYMKGPYFLKKTNLTHWLIQDSFETISKEILNHIKKY